MSRKIPSLRATMRKQKAQALVCIKKELQSICINANVQESCRSNQEKFVIDFANEIILSYSFQPRVLHFWLTWGKNYSHLLLWVGFLNMQWLAYSQWNMLVVLVSLWNGYPFLPGSTRHRLGMLRARPASVPLTQWYLHSIVTHGPPFMCVATSSGFWIGSSATNTPVGRTTQCWP